MGKVCAFLYAVESYFTGSSSRLRRYSLRLDGCASVFAPREGGEIVTKPLVFAGGTLSLNLATSAAGSIRVEIQDGGDLPIEGYALEECEEIFGDAVDYTVGWKHGADLRPLADKPARLRIALREADVYAPQFTP